MVDTKFPILHEKDVREFYYNIVFCEDDSINTKVGDVRVHLDEDLHGNILGFPREGIKYCLKDLLCGICQGMF